MKMTVKGCIAVLSLTALTSLAHAANPGAYAGLGLGWGKQKTARHVDYNNTYTLNRENSKLSERVFAGYNFNQNYGIEMGLANYGHSEYKTKNLSSKASLTYRMQALDVVGKAYLPFADSFNAYGLAGGAYVRSAVKAKATGAKTAESIQRKIRPIVGAGVSYDIPQTKLTTNLEYSHIFGKGNVEKDLRAIPSADLVSLNLSYNFS